MTGASDELLDELRGPAFAVAYRMLGSVTEAEDVVQEALLRVHHARESDEPIASLRAYTTTVVTRLALDELRSARARRETYVGDWLPEPLVTDDLEPERHAEMADSLSMAFLVLLESLTPEQRAVLLLHDVFDYDYDEVAEIIGKSVDNTRQLVVRARRRVDERRVRFDASRAERDELAKRFLSAAQSGDMQGLESLLAEDVALRGDGGGKVPALAKPLYGRDRVARTLLAWIQLGKRIPGASIRQTTVNGQPGALLLDGDARMMGVWSLDIVDGQIQGIRSIVNPDKLRHLGPVVNYTELIDPPNGE